MSTKVSKKYFCELIELEAPYQLPREFIEESKELFIKEFNIDDPEWLLNFNVEPILGTNKYLLRNGYIDIWSYI